MVNLNVIRSEKKANTQMTYASIVREYNIARGYNCNNFIIALPDNLTAKVTCYKSLSECDVLPENHNDCDWFEIEGPDHHNWCENTLYDLAVSVTDYAAKRREYDENAINKKFCTDIIRNPAHPGYEYACELYDILSRLSA
ncbi:hypothetical protein J6A31_05920 [bacterium]|nr:hypothetical protein [bacterium]